MFNIFEDKNYLDSKEQLISATNQYRNLDQDINSNSIVPKNQTSPNPEDEGNIDFVTKRKKNNDFSLYDSFNTLPESESELVAQKEIAVASDSIELLGNSNTGGDKKKASEYMSFLGQQGQGESQAIMGFVKEGVNLASTRTKSEAEGYRNIANTTMAGAQAGMTIGGPWGAAIGAAVGLIYSGIDTMADSDKNESEKRHNNKSDWELKKTQREQDYKMEQGQQALTNLKRLREAQSNFSI